MHLQPIVSCNLKQNIWNKGGGEKLLVSFVGGLVMQKRCPLFGSG